jgi:hypothetical protein
VVGALDKAEIEAECQAEFEEQEKAKEERWTREVTNGQRRALVGSCFRRGISRRGIASLKGALTL